MPAHLVIPPCEHTSAHPNHLPLDEKPLRIQVLGLNSLIDQVFEDGMHMPSQERPIVSPVDFDEVGTRFAKMAFKLLYRRDVDPTKISDFVPLHQYHIYRGKHGECQPWEHTIEGYGIIFDHCVPEEDDDPETLMINVYDPSDPQSASYCSLDLDLYKTNPATVLLVPRCCQLRKGTTDRTGINGQVKEAKEKPTKVRAMV